MRHALRTLVLACLLALGAAGAAHAAPAAGHAARFDTIAQVLDLPPANPAPMALPALAAQPSVNVEVKTPPADTSVSLPVMAWGAAMSGLLAWLLKLALGFAKSRMPTYLVWALQAYGEDKAINQAVAFAINAIPGVARGVPLKVDVGNRVIALAAQWLVDTAPRIVAAAGGEQAIKAKIMAALHLDAEAGADALGVRLPG